MNQALLLELQKKTEEELRLAQSGNIDRSLYISAGDRKTYTPEIDCALLLEHGKYITLHRHPRGVHFPRHTHNYVEMVYMCSGKTTHLIGDSTVTLREGELLLLGQSAKQEILPAAENDIAVNFIILPEFFDTTLQMMGNEESPLRDFLLACLSGKQPLVNFLHFAVSDILPIQNLVENLIWTLSGKQQNKRSINKWTMALLFTQLTYHTETLYLPPVDSVEQRMLYVLRYIDNRYRDGSLSEIARDLHYDEAFLSREIKRSMGKTYTELLQDKRLSQAAFLLQSTKLSVRNIAEHVGYENISYFHRIFAMRFGATPHKYRKCK